MAIIGDSFGAELAAAGLAGLAFSWGPDGDIQGRENLTAAQKTALDAVIAAHNPAAPAPKEPAAVDNELTQSLALRGLVRMLAAAGIAGLPATEAGLIAAIKIEAVK